MTTTKTKTRSFGTTGPKDPLAPLEIERRAPRASDVQIEILWSGVCHSDIHTARSEWAGTIYPCVPGHEILGRVTRVGESATKFKVGDIAAVGCMVDTTDACANCEAGLEQYCVNHKTIWTYNSPDPDFPGRATYGGYSSSIVVAERFCFRVPQNLDLAGAAPLLCAGATLWSPLKHWGATRGKKVGIVGLGGLGHMGVKLASALGAETVLFTSKESKRGDARRLGASSAVLSSDADAMVRERGSFDLIIDTVAVSHDLDEYTRLLKRDGTLVLVGVPEHAHPSPSAGLLITGRRSIAGSLIGGTRETQEMLDFCGERNIVSDVEKIPMDGINEAYERMIRGDVRYRFVIDIATLR